MKIKSDKILRVIIALCEAAIGIPLLINAQALTTIIFMAIGAFLGVFGIINIIGYFRVPSEQAAFSQKLALGLIAIVGGIFCIVYSGDMGKFQVFLYGLFTLILGIFKIQWTVNLIRLHIQRWYILGISTLITVIFSVIIIFNVKAAFEAFSLFIAISLIVESIADLAAVIFSGTLEDSNKNKEIPDDSSNS